MSHHDQVAIQSRAVIQIEKSRTIPRLRHAELQNIHGKRSSVAFVLPQVIQTQIRE
jgi:hypothetical protein